MWIFTQNSSEGLKNQRWLLQGEIEQAEQSRAEQEKTSTAPLTREDFGELNLRNQSSKILCGQFSKIKAEIKEIRGQVRDLEIKVEENLLSAVNLQHKIKIFEREKKKCLQRKLRTQKIMKKEIT